MVGSLCFEFFAREILASDLAVISTILFIICEIENYHFCQCLSFYKACTIRKTEFLTLVLNGKITHVYDYSWVDGWLLLFKDSFLLTMAMSSTLGTVSFSSWLRLSVFDELLTLIFHIRHNQFLWISLLPCLIKVATSCWNFISCNLWIHWIESYLAVAVETQSLAWEWWVFFL